MRFLTYNLWHGLRPATPLIYEALEPTERRRLRYQAQLDLLSNLKPDVCFFQECNPARRRAPELARVLGHRQTNQPDLVGLKLFGLGVPVNLNSALVITAAEGLGLRRVDAISLTRPQLNLSRSWGSWQVREERFALFSEVRRPNGDRLLLVDTHLHHGIEQTPEFSARLEALGEELALSDSLMSELRSRLARGNARRALEIGHLLHRLERYRDRYRAIVLAGDFNVAPGGEAHARLVDAGFTDVWAAAHPRGEGFTYDPDRNAANHVLQARFPLTLVVEDLSFSPKIKDALVELIRAHEFKPRRIDYLWVRTDRGEPARITRADLVGLPDADGLAPSDHFGVAAELEF